MADILRFTPPLAPHGLASPETADGRRGPAEVIILPVVRIERHAETGLASTEPVGRPAGRSG